MNKGYDVSQSDVRKVLNAYQAYLQPGAAGVKVPEKLTLYIQDDLAKGKTTSASVVKKLTLDFTKTDDEKKAKIDLLLSLSDHAQVVGIQKSDDSKIRFRETFKANLAGEPRNIRLINLNAAPPKPPEHKAISASKTPETTTTDAGGVRQVNMAADEPDEEDIDLDAHDVVTDAEFDKHFVEMLYGGPTIKPEAGKIEKEKKQEGETATHLAESGQTITATAATVTDRLARKTSGVFGATVLSQAALSKKKFEEKEKEKDAKAAAQNREIVQQEVEKHDIKQENIQEQQQAKENTKVAESVVEFTKQVNQGENPDSDKFTGGAHT